LLLQGLKYTMLFLFVEWIFIIVVFFESLASRGVLLVAVVFIMVGPLGGVAS
jgi:hypothetical protein